MPRIALRTTRPLGAAALSLAAATAAFTAPSPAQVPATNDVAACTLLADPTAQRSCLESARQKRPAASFDPSATRPRASRGRAQDGDVTGLDRSADLDRRRSPRRRKTDAPPASAGAQADQPTQIP